MGSLSSAPLRDAAPALRFYREHMTVTADDLRTLLSSTEPGATLVLEEGKTKIYSRDQAAKLSSWVVTTLDDLRHDLPDADNPTAHDLDERAAMLDSTIASQGG